METATTHEARARNAKAQALATVLHEHRITPDSLTVVLDLLASQQDDVDLVGAFWAKVAEVATLRGLQGEGVTVHVPHSRATIDAVARILGDLIAHENDQAAIAEQVAPQPTAVAGETPDCDQAFGGIWPCALPLGHDGDHNGGWVDGKPPADRKATDSGEYRRTVRALDRETAQAFAAFGQADRR